MGDFITLSCPNCGGRLEITADIDRFACIFCNTEHLVKRAGNIVSLAPVLESLGGLRTGVDRTASEMAMKRLSDEIRLLQDHDSRLEDIQSRISRYWAAQAVVKRNALYGTVGKIGALPMYLIMLVGAAVACNGIVKESGWGSFAGIVLLIFALIGWAGAQTLIRIASSKVPIPDVTDLPGDLSAHLQRADQDRLAIATSISDKEQQLEKHRAIVARI
jgi:hypothetical protein